MDSSKKEILRAVVQILEQLRLDEQEILGIDPDPAERLALRETVYDLGQASSLLQRVVYR